ncbi:3-oxoacyl-[acyl-carrier-protein] synthase III C-terminal domain-containing protein [Chroococcidiopsis sp. CCMEE 29]|uniref:3-oxoacyl-[acyl-carrier-protein] synthase III C-terminal domain-containing protein n=1 Tax=Chroococcidiopsis sp. CCMEE 29 TaxID=155894 RepID=UPI00202071A4|nr:3-oxoacyl-[acyl-carrier-protein] synthase III C-terminal domain-containing protein [Chroococcidiopsis sp. CCMEE 29]
MKCPVGIRSLAVSFPSLIRTNDYWLEKYPNLIARTPRRRVRSHAPAKSITDREFDSNGFDIWSQAVAPYLSDPFRGSVERRILNPDESALMLECQVAKDALEAATLPSNDVELMIVTSLFSEPTGIGNAADLAHQLNLRCPTWNLESTCSSALVALQSAFALVQAKEYRNVLVVVSHIGSQSVDPEDTLSWSMGDGAGAFIVDSLKPNQGVLGSKIVNTAVTRGAYFHEMVIDAQGKFQICTRTGENISAIAETAVEFVRTCCEGAVANAGVTLDQIDFFAFNTPTAWYASVCTRALDIDPGHTINLYPQYANIGPVFPIVNLYHAADTDRIRENDLVLVYTNGAGATAGAIVMRWGDVALGTVPAPPIRIIPKQEKIHLAEVDPCSQERTTLHQTGNLSREQLLAAEPTQRRLMLENYLIGWLTSSLQLPQAELTSQQSFASLLDSLMALMFRSRIASDLQLPVPMEKFFGDNTIAQLVEQLLNQLALTNLIESEKTSAATGDEKDREKLSL